MGMQVCSRRLCRTTSAGSGNRESHRMKILRMRISLNGDHPFRSKPITRFAPNRSPVSLQTDHPFRTKRIVEFSDFQCPFCSRFVALHDALLSEGLRVRVLYRHFPIPNHPHARNAAIASECAAAQDQFEAMHRTMFGLADSLGTLSWSSLASRAGVPDSAAFVRCLESPESAAAISRDSVAAYKLGLRGTPTLLIGSTRVEGLPLLDSLRVYVKRASTDAP